jgi:hypothetical protein
MAGVRGWLWRLLDRGEPEAVDPDAIVEAGFVGVVAAEIVMARLTDEGIRAEALEERPGGPEGAALMVRIVSRAADVDAVRRVIDDVTTL